MPNFFFLKIFSFLKKQSLRTSQNTIFLKNLILKFVFFVQYLKRYVISYEVYSNGLVAFYFSKPLSTFLLSVTDQNFPKNNLFFSTFRKIDYHLKKTEEYKKPRK